MNQEAKAPAPPGGSHSWWLLAVVAAALVILIYAAIPPTLPEPGELAGSWARDDGGEYTIEIRSVAADGKADIGYFNPKPINVSQASVARRDEGLRVDVELQDEGYPGSTYALLYDPKSGRLVGEYFQAQGNQRFPVSFTRKAPENAPAEK